MKSFAFLLALTASAAAYDRPAIDLSGDTVIVDPAQIGNGKHKPCRVEVADGQVRVFDCVFKGK